MFTQCIQYVVLSTSVICGPTACTVALADIEEHSRCDFTSCTACSSMYICTALAFLPGLFSCTSMLDERGTEVPTPGHVFLTLIVQQWYTCRSSSSSSRCSFNRENILARLISRYCTLKIFDLQVSILPQADCAPCTSSLQKIDTLYMCTAQTGSKKLHGDSLHDVSIHSIKLKLLSSGNVSLHLTVKRNSKQ